MIRVLIVDDEIRLAEAFQEQLTEEGMSIYSFPGQRSVVYHET